MRRHLEQYHPDEISDQHVNKKARLVLGETESESPEFQLLDASENGSIVELGEDGFGESEVERGRFEGGWFEGEGFEGFGFEGGEHGGGFDGEFEAEEYGAFDGGFEAGGQEDRTGESGLGESSVGEREQGNSLASSAGAAIRVQQFPGAGTSS
jgi:hypothetical protein